MSKDTGGPAFPCPELRLDDGTGVVAACDGMTLRDYFAGQALIPFVGHCLDQAQEKGDTAEIAAKRYARSAYFIADAMIAERNKP